jgi:hypothetical protein
MNAELLSYRGTVLEVWIANNGRIAGTDILTDICVGRGTFKYEFAGKQKTYIVVSNDDRITRDIALAFAICYHKGQYKKVHLDLSEVSSPR